MNIQYYKSSVFTAVINILKVNYSEFILNCKKHLNTDVKNYLSTSLITEVCSKDILIIIHIFYNEIFLNYILINIKEFIVSLKYVQLHLNLNI